MLRSRIHRLSTAVLVVLSLLFAQLALAGYVCPQEEGVDAMTARMEAWQSAGVPLKASRKFSLDAADPLENIDIAIEVNSARGAASLEISGNTAALIIGMPVMGYAKGKIAF